MKALKANVIKVRGLKKYKVMIKNEFSSSPSVSLLFRFKILKAIVKARYKKIIFNNAA